MPDMHATHPPTPDMNCLREPFIDQLLSFACFCALMLSSNVHTSTSAPSCVRISPSGDFMYLTQRRSPFLGSPSGATAVCNPPGAPAQPPPIPPKYPTAWSATRPPLEKLSRA